MTIFGIFLGAPGWIGLGLILGWFLLPAPKFIVNLWARLGLTDRVP